MLWRPRRGCPWPGLEEAVPGRRVGLGPYRKGWPGKKMKRVFVFLAVGRLQLLAKGIACRGGGGGVRGLGLRRPRAGRRVLCLGKVLWGKAVLVFLQLLAKEMAWEGMEWVSGPGLEEAGAGGEAFLVFLQLLAKGIVCGGRRRVCMALA